MTSEASSIEKDPVCGMTVDPARAAATHEHAGKTYYFCCRGCQEKFRAEPAKYLKSGGLHVQERSAVSPHPCRIVIAPASSHAGNVPPATVAALCSHFEGRQRIHLPDGS